MSFARPALLALLALPLLLAAWEWVRRGHPVVVPADHTGVRSRDKLAGLVKVAAWAAPAAWAAAILILAGPQHAEIPQEERVLNNIEVVMDISGSMSAPYGDGTRSTEALQAINDFTTFRKDDAFGLTVFGNEVLHWVPLTKDLDAIRLSAPFIDPTKMPPYFGGTQIGKALDRVYRLLANREDGDRMIVLISDGQSGDLDPATTQELIAKLTRERVTVFYVHVAEGEPQPEVSMIASSTGGEAFVAGDPASLRGVFQRIDAMKPAKLKPAAPVSVDYFKPFALAGLIAAALQFIALFGLRFVPW